MLRLLAGNSWAEDREGRVTVNHFVGQMIHRKVVGGFVSSSEAYMCVA